MKIEIQNAILQKIHSVTYPQIVYDKDGYASESSTNTNVKCHALVNEARASFGIDKANTQRFRQNNTGWDFEANLGFNVEVALDNLIVSFCNEPLFFETEGVILLVTLDSYEVSHPVQQEPEQGTRCSLKLSVSWLRK